MLSAEAAIQPKDAQLRVILFNKVGSKDTAIGEADVNLNDLTPNQTWKEWHTLGDDKNKAKVLLEINLVTDVVRHLLNRREKKNFLSKIRFLPFFDF